jgi:hypothetical protein
MNPDASACMDIDSVAQITSLLQSLNIASVDVANDPTTMPQSLDDAEDGNEGLVQLLFQMPSLVL